MGILDAKTDAKIRELIQRGQKLEGVKLYRSALKASLKEASDAVNAIEATMVVSRPDLKWGADWLPARCPSCGAGVSADTVEWADAMASSARCPFCSTVMREPGE